VTTLHRKGRKQDLAALAELVEQYVVEEIVLGLPKNLNNSVGEQAEKVQKFAKSLEGRFYPIPIKLWDERFSTAAAERVLLDADLSRKKRKHVVNTLAAVVILQNYLDSKSL
jgi:putative Holliday junction resolvase